MSVARVGMVTLLLVAGCDSSSTEEPLAPSVPSEVATELEPTPPTEMEEEEEPSYACWSETIREDRIAGSVESVYSGYDENDPTILLYEAVDEEADGIIEETWEYTYDSDGRLWRVLLSEVGVSLGIEFTYPPDGELPSSQTIDVATGEVLSEIQRIYTDGLLTEIRGTTVAGPFFYQVLEYNEGGGLVSSSTSADGDLVFDEVVTYERDDQQRSLVIHTDLGADGVVNRVWTLDYTEATGLSGTASLDDDNDGVEDSNYEFLYDAMDRYVEGNMDYDLDGVFDAQRTVTYHSDGQLRDDIWVGTNEDGVPFAQEQRHSFDALGRRLSETEFESLDGVASVDFESVTVYGGTCP